MSTLTDLIAEALSIHWFTTVRTDAGNREPGCRCGAKQAEDNRNAERHSAHLAGIAAAVVADWLESEATRASLIVALAELAPCASAADATSALATEARKGADQ